MEAAMTKHAGKMSAIAYKSKAPQHHAMAAQGHMMAAQAHAHAGNHQMAAQHYNAAREHLIHAGAKGDQVPQRAPVQSTPKGSCLSTGGGEQEFLVTQP
jgi:hypothetical protein